MAHRVSKSQTGLKQLSAYAQPVKWSVGKLMSPFHETGAQSGAPSRKVVQGLHTDAQDEAAKNSH